MAAHGQTSYHDTVSKMARKYSQYRLPQPSELVESDDDEYNNYADNNNNSLNKQQSINSTSYNSTIIHNNKDAEDTPNDDEEDEDIFSDTNTMISHQSLSRQIREIEMDGELFTSIFDEYFDESKEGDVDYEEFAKGLLKLGVNINNEQISKLFHVLLMNGDNENDGYLERAQFSDFLTRRFEAPQLVAFQDLLLSIIMEITKKDESQKWDPSDVALQEMEMRQAMEQMVDNEMQKINACQELNEEVERRMADPEFCTDLNAENWDYYEVAYWVHKIGYDYAIKRFFDQEIDGNVLLYDINITMLINQLGLTQLHSNKFMTNLYQLKQKIFTNKNKENESKIHEMELKIIEINSEKKLFETKSTEKLLNLQRELNKTEEKLLKSQQEIVALKEKLSCIKNIRHDILKQFDNKLIDYNSIKRQFGSYSLSNYVQQLQDKANDDDGNFAVPQDAAKWSNEEVSYWLTTIGMKKYLTPFIEQFVDGQILLNDINTNNLVSDLDVKSVHAPKIMRELNKLKKTVINPIEYVVYSNNNDICNQNDSTTMSTKYDVLYPRHLRTESNEMRENIFFFFFTIYIFISFIFLF